MSYQELPSTNDPELKIILDNMTEHALNLCIIRQKADNMLATMPFEDDTWMEYIGELSFVDSEMEVLRKELQALQVKYG